MGNIWKIVLATVVIYAAGAITGGLLVNHAHRGTFRRAERPANNAQSRGTNAAAPSWQPASREVLQRNAAELRPLLEQQRMEFVLRVQRDLRLTPEQHERIEKIVREGQEETKEFWEKAQPELRKLVQETREKIRSELTPEQRTKFEALLKQQRNPRAGEGPGNSAEPRRQGGSGEPQPRGNRPPADRGGASQ